MPFDEQVNLVIGNYSDRPALSSYFEVHHRCCKSLHRFKLQQIRQLEIALKCLVFYIVNIEAILVLVECSLHNLNY